MKKLLLLICFIFVAVGGAFLYCNFYIQQEVFIESEKIVEIPKGASLNSMALLLEQNGVIDQPKLFVKIGQFYGYQNQIKYGEFLIVPTDRFIDVYSKVIKGENVKYPLTFVEGDHMYQYARVVGEKGYWSPEKFLSLVKDKSLVQEMLGESHDSFEGYLFPETYHFSKNDSELTIVKTMVNKFLEMTKTINFNQLGLNRHKAVTLASIVEKETGAEFERRRISSVFHNRLKKNMRLQTDPTILYGIMHATGQEVNNIRKQDIRAKTLYNTYVINGLPPGPIANPGIEALKASVDPETSEYLYFVSQNDGTHIFTSNYNDHLKAVKKYQLDPKMRAGKSWRDLKKKAK